MLIVACSCRRSCLKIKVECVFLLILWFHIITEEIIKIIIRFS